MEDKYTSHELKRLEKMVDDLIIWMFHTPNDRYPIEKMMKGAFDFGKESTDKTGDSK